VEPEKLYKLPYYGGKVWVLEDDMRITGLQANRAFARDLDE
jgi:hypothetical protein